jgi:biotin carboxyl carrier protein
MLSVKVNAENAFDIAPSMLQSLDLVALPGNEIFHLVRNHKTYAIEVLEKNIAEKTLVLRINGRTYLAQAEDELDKLLKQLGMSASSSTKVNNIKAPMPGLILQVLVTEGQTIQKGDSVLILEAMKMENVIKSPGDGVVKTVKVQQGAPVDKNQILIELV